MRPSDLGRLVWAADPKVSPDGERVVYVVTRVDLEGNRYRSRLWLASVGEGGAPGGQPLTSGDEDGSPCWSPDGRRLAFTSKRDGDRHSLHTIPVDGPGEVVTLATFPEPITELAWSPDGRWVACCTRTRDPRYALEPKAQPPRRITRFFSRLDDVGWIVDRPKHVYVVAADGSGQVRNLTPGEHEHAGPAWLPDSSGVVVSAARHATWDLDLAADLYRVGLDGSVVALTHHTGKYELASVSPDGTKVAFLGYDDPSIEPQNAHIGVLDLATGERRWVSTSFDRTWAPFPGARPPAWNGERLLCLVEDRGGVHLYGVPVDGGEPEPIVTGARCLGAFDVAGATLAFSASDSTHPSEVFAIVRGEERRVSRAADGFVAAVSPRPAERFTVASTGGEVDAWIVLPAGFDPQHRYPALLNIHGGPFTQYGDKFFDEAQLQADSGYVVLLSNPRGSSGRETAWGRAIAGPKVAKDPGTGWGSVDADDLMAVVDEALRRFPFIDPDRLGVLGGSYGGYMTTWIVGHTSRFKAACSERAVNNLQTEEWGSDLATAFRTELGVTVLDDPAEYLRLSPISYVRDIHTPLLILHSEDDLRCPIEQAEQLFVLLRMQGREVEFYRFPGEGHELSRSGSPVHRRMRAELILEFFGRHLKPSDVEAASEGAEDEYQGA